MFRFNSLLIVSALFLAEGSTLGAKSRSGQEARLSFEVRVHNYANLPAGMIKMATDTADKVFKSAGVEIRWIDCTPNSAKKHESCSTEQADQTRVLRIVSPEMTAKLPASGIEFGRAMLNPEATRGTFASIYWGRVQELAAGRARTVSLGMNAGSNRLNEARILGYVLAHELGHLFGVHHSKAGVMNGPWSPSELAELLKATLRFQASEEERIRLSLTDEG